MPLETKDPTGLCGNLVVGGSTQTANGTSSSEENAFAASLGAQAIFPFSGEGYLGSMMTIEAAAAGGAGSRVDQVRDAIAGLAAAGPGSFTLYGFSGGAQIIQTALNQLDPAIASRAIVVGISPGYGFAGAAQFPSNLLTVWGGVGGAEEAVMAAAGANGLTSGSILTTGCKHNANCEFAAAAPRLATQASPACPSTPPNPPGGGSGGGDLSFWGITGNFIDILFLRWSVTVSQTFGQK